jgi:hypothetical protein
MQDGGDGCRDDGTGKSFPAPKNYENSAWVTVDIVAGSSPNEVVYDLSSIHYRMKWY